MKANELMIGDWVGYYSKDKIKGNPYPLQIHEIRNKSITLVSNSCLYQVADLNELSPIPLTPEILEKNGFKIVLDEDGIECYRYYNSAADGYIKISLYNGGDSDWSVKIINYDKFNDSEIVYNNNFIFLKVHELQHALKLCGIEKTIII